MRGRTCRCYLRRTRRHTRKARYRASHSPWLRRLGCTFPPCRFRCGTEHRAHRALRPPEARKRGTSRCNQHQQSGPQPSRRVVRGSSPSPNAPTYKQCCSGSGVGFRPISWSYPNVIQNGALGVRRTEGSFLVHFHACLRLGAGLALTCRVLAYERMDVYQWAVEFLALVARVLEKMPRWNSGLSDQLRRASPSIPLSIAEGSGKPTASKTKRVHFQGRPRLSLRILGFGMSGSMIDQALSESSIPSLDQNYQPLSITSTTTTTTTSASASTRPEVFVR